MGIFACYLDENGEYQWTDKPDPNWKLIPEITKPDEIPIKTKVASSTQTSHLNQNPTPTPNSEPTLSPEPTPTRFSEKINADGSKTIYDYENRYTINYTKEYGYIAFNDKGEEVYHIYPDGNVDIKTYGLEGKDGFVICHDNTSIDEMGSNMTLVDSVDKIEYSFRNGKLVKRVYKDGSSDNITYNNDGTYSVKRLNMVGDEEIFQYDEHNILYREDYSFILENGNYGAYSRVYLYDVDVYDEKKVFLEGNEVVDYYYDDNYDSHRVVIGKIDNDGNYVINGENGEVSTYNAFGQRIKRIDSSGNVYDYDYDYVKNSQIVTRNDRRSYSKINHIEYDEEAYNNIIKSFNSVGSSYQGVITSACSSIESAVNSFPDSYSSAGISSVGSSVEGHIGLISSLGEMTNYSILAYQTCDEELKSGLESLIDSLFGDSDTTLSENFKKAINNTIEERDGIISYKEGTIFKNTSCIVDLLMNSPNITFLDGEELEEFKKNYNLAPLDTLLVGKETENINGVDFDIYRVVDANDYDGEGYNKYVKESNELASNINDDVLKYMKDKGTHIVYYSGHTVDKTSYDENGNYSNNYYAGYAQSLTRGAVSVYRKKNPNDIEPILHEMGHTLDHCICYDQTGEIGKSTTQEGYDYSFLPNKTNTRELALKESDACYDEYRYLYFYNNYKCMPNEFFAESFSNYYTTDVEQHEKYADLIPETFEFFSNIEKWVGEQNAN